MDEEVVIYKCSHVGVAGTTDVHVRLTIDGKFIARCGIAIMGSTNMDEEGFKACNYDPFHDKFHDNYAQGMGETQAEAIEALKSDMHQTADSIWGI